MINEEIKRYLETMLNDEGKLLYDQETIKAQLAPIDNDEVLIHQNFEVVKGNFCSNDFE